MLRYLWLLMFIVPFVSAEFIFDDSLYAASSLQTEVRVGAEIDFTSSPSEITAKLLYFPIEISGQQIQSVSYAPQPQSITSDSILYEFTNPRQKQSFLHTSVVDSYYHRPQIRQEISYPFEIPPEARQYLQSSEIIRVTDDIAAQASSIVGDEDDAVRIAFLLGSWVNQNIDYDLNSVTADASQTSQWVLENGYGVCDELTSLFIAMLRSQGIPARFVSGVAYTNLEVLDTPWGPHGWAEVWFPDIGWVPYDVTYGQFGFVDATHIAFQTSIDAKTTAVEYSMRSRNSELLPSSIETDVELVSSQEPTQTLFAYEITPALESVGFGSANRIDVTLTNQQEYYVSTELHLARSEHIQAVQYDVPVLLAPGESRTIPFFVEVADDLQRDFVYTFPVIVHTNDNQRFETEFTSRRIARSYSKEALGYQEQELAFSTLRCEYETSVSVNKEFIVTCMQQGEQVCVEDVCDTDQVTYSAVYDTAQAVTLQATSDSAKRFITLLVQDAASINTSVEAPQSISSSQQAKITVSLIPTSQTTPTDIQAKLTHPLFSQEFTARSLNSQQEVVVDIPTEYLLLNENEFVLTTNYNTSESFVIVVESDSFSSWLRLATNSLSAWANSLMN